jgi:alpha,alpha-trehalose phosphorylase
MSAHPALVVHPWRLHEQHLDIDLIARSESLFALSNGHIGMRANLDEGEPHGIPGTYLNSVAEIRPLPYAEAGYGYPEEGWTVINVANGKLIRLLVDDEPFDVRYGHVHSHERTLDFRTGLLERRVEWESPAGRRVKIHSTRMVSFTERSIAAICYEVEAVDAPVRIVVQSELVANEQLPVPTKDPRVAAVLENPLASQEHWARDARVELLHTTRQSQISVAAAMDHIIEGPDRIDVSSEVEPDWGRVSVTTRLKPGEKLSVTKLLAYGWSSRRSLPALRDQAAAALTAALHTGWEQLLADQREYLDIFWACGDVEVDGDAALQQAVRFAMFHVLQAGARAERRPIAAKGMTGPGYDGHCFWDSETFVLPVLTATAPSAALSALWWRHATLDQARERARVLGLAGAAFPWRTIRGAECSGYWPAGTAGFHINADIADAVGRYLAATGDESFEREGGLELLVETARLWLSLGHHDIHGGFRIDGVTGPDEYSAIADNNVYTNLMAQRNLQLAADVAGRWPREARRLGVSFEEIARWRNAASDIVIPYDPDLGVHPQAESYTNHERWDFESTSADEYPLLLHFPYFDLYRKQVVKQADLVLALHLRGDCFTAEEKRRNFDYYDELTVRDSSLSACTQAIVAAEVGHLDLAYDYAAEAALMDLHDLAHNTTDGLHMASLAGSWLALVAGFGGMRDHGEHLAFRPRLPPALTALSFTMLRRNQRLRVEITRDRVRYLLPDPGDPMTILHNGAEVTVSHKASVARRLETLPEQEPPNQPPGRAPEQRSGMVTSGGPTGTRARRT